MSTRSAAVFDQFCKRCDTFLNRDGGTDPAYSTPWFHSVLGDVKSAANSGCHLCSVFVRCIEETYNGEDLQTPIQLFVKGKILRIRVGLDAARHTPALRLEVLDKDDLTSIGSFRQTTCMSSSSQSISEQISRWKRVCQSDHALCLHQPGVRLPTRLLHHSSTYVKVVDAEGVLPAYTEYMTLSHRWPKTPGMKLEKNTLTDFQNGFPLTSMPPLFRDFCELSTMLGNPYTWVDALCIVQDDDQDWLKESALMVDIYANSQLNIVAGCSQQHGSLYSERNLLMLSPAVVSGSAMSKALGVNGIFTFNSDEKGQIARLPTDHRAWILQECELSPRMVYCGDTELIWECTSKLQCESSQCGGINWLEPETSNDPRNIRSQLARFRWDYIGLTEARCHSIWTGLVSKYTSLNISFETDRLVAISGLSQYLQKIAFDQFGEYYAGLWEIGFEKQLLWRPYDNSDVVSSATYLAPSWSWASHTSRIAYHGSPPGARSMSSLIENLTVCPIPVSPGASHGQLKDGYFTCLANVIQIHLSYEQVGSQYAYNWSVQSSSSCPKSQINILITLDRPSEISLNIGSHNHFRDFYLMPLLCYDINDHTERYEARPRRHRLFTEWQCANAASSPNPFPRGRWSLEIAGEDLYSLAALVLFPVAERKGHYTRAGIAEFGSPVTIDLLQEACMSSLLATELYISRPPDRCAYEICVC